MAILGKINPLKVVKQVDFGLYLDGGSDGEILLPTRYVPEGVAVGDTVSVFIYNDSDDRLIATTERPLAMVGEFAFLQVAAVSGPGAFLEWGLAKQLFVPYREQREPMVVGRNYPVFVYVDYESRRITASSKLARFIDTTKPELKEGDEVELLVYQQTDLGWKAIVNQQYCGVLYRNEVFRTLTIGQVLKGYIKLVRPDDKIDLTLHKPGYEKVGDFAPVLYDQLKAAGGFLPLTDKTPSEDIYNRFGVSKKTFKKVVGDLYKKRMIVLENSGIKVANLGEEGF